MLLRKPRPPKNFECSFASNPRSSCWSKDGLNGSIKPHMVCMQSRTYYWSDCDTCSHQFKARPSHIYSGSWCPFCACFRLCRMEDCTMCFAKSLATNARAVKCWSERNALPPHCVSKSSEIKVWFKCDVCEHTFDTSPGNITHVGCWCPYCATNNSKLCLDANCTWCFDRSLASILLTHSYVRWDKDANGTLEPRQVSKHSNAKAHFQCLLCMRSVLILVASVTAGGGCKLCKRKSERKLFVQLRCQHPTLQSGFTADWCRNVRALPFDFALAADKILIELDGDQHFKQVRNWKISPEEIHNRDVYKQTCANNNGYRVIRVLQTDVWDDKNDWLAKVVAAIEELRSNGGAVANIYICSGNEYDIFTK